jgi:hypothetical protein
VQWRISGETGCRNAERPTIKKIVPTAHALAIVEESEIRPQDIQISLQSIKDFEEDFEHDLADAVREIAGPSAPSASEHRAKRRRQA